MSEYIHNFFLGESSGKHFHQVIPLHDSPQMSWDTISSLIPLFPRGWWELSQLSSQDRIEFTHEFWHSKLSFIANVSTQVDKRLSEFFESLEEIGIYATQVKKNSPFDIYMVYTLKEGAGFFQGSPPATQDVLEALSKRFGHINFPADYLAFLRIHDGFSKYIDTGMIKSRDMAQVYQRFQHLLAEDMLMRPDGQLIDPENLIPFYESFALHCYQCFYADWFPEEEMGNVYFSEHERSISNYLDSFALEENLAFSSFVSWLIFYLEDIVD